MDINEEMKLREWAQDMADQKSSGLSRRVWCQTRNMPLSTYEYRCRRVRKAMEKRMDESQSGAIISVHKELAEPVFAKVNITSPECPAASGISIHKNNLSLNIAPDTPEEHIRIVLEVIGNA